MRTTHPACCSIRHDKRLRRVFKTRKPRREQSWLPDLACSMSRPACRPEPTGEILRYSPFLTR